MSRTQWWIPEVRKTWKEQAIERLVNRTVLLLDRSKMSDMPLSVGDSHLEKNIRQVAMVP